MDHIYTHGKASVSDVLKEVKPRPSSRRGAPLAGLAAMITVAVALALPLGERIQAHAAANVAAQPGQTKSPEQKGRERAAADIKAGTPRILYYGKPWSLGKPLVDEASGLRIEIAAGCCVMPEFVAETDAYNAAMRQWAKSRPASSTRSAGSGQASSGQSTQPAGVSDSPWRVKLPSGVTVELVGVSENPAPGVKRWWRPDGTPLAGAPSHYPEAAQTRQDLDPPGNEFVINVIGVPFPCKPGDFEAVKRIQQDPPDPLPTSEPDLKPGQVHVQFRMTAAGWTWRDMILPPVDTPNGARYSWVYVLVQSFPRSQERTTINMGFGAGDWQTLATDTINGEASSRSFAGIRGTNLDVSFAASFEADWTNERDKAKHQMTAHVTVAHNVPADQQVRVVAILMDGTEAIAGTNPEITDGRLQQITQSFRRGATGAPKDNLSIKDIKEFRLQSRPLQWAEFKNVSLRPAGKTSASTSRTPGPLTRSAGSGQHTQPTAATRPATAPATQPVFPLPDAEPGKLFSLPGDLIEKADCIFACKVLKVDWARKQPAQPKTKGTDSNDWGKEFDFNDWGIAQVQCSVPIRGVQSGQTVQVLVFPRRFYFTFEFIAEVFLWSHVDLKPGSQWLIFASKNSEDAQPNLPDHASKAARVLGAARIVTGRETVIDEAKKAVSIHALPAEKKFAALKDVLANDPLGNLLAGYAGAHIGNTKASPVEIALAINTAIKRSAKDEWPCRFFLLQVGELWRKFLDGKKNPQLAAALQTMLLEDAPKFAEATGDLLDDYALTLLYVFHADDKPPYQLPGTLPRLAVADSHGVAEALRRMAREMEQVEARLGELLKTAQEVGKSGLRSQIDYHVQLRTGLLKLAVALDAAPAASTGSGQATQPAALDEKAARALAARLANEAFARQAFKRPNGKPVGKIEIAPESFNDVSQKVGRWVLRMVRPAGPEAFVDFAADGSDPKVVVDFAWR